MQNRAKKLIGKECKIHLVSGSNGYGKILDVGKIGLLTEKIDDFHFDGQCFYPRSAITNVWYRKQEVFYEHLQKFKPHHIYDTVDMSGLSNFENFFSALQHTIILLEKKNKKTFFCRIVHIDNTYITVQTFDTYGKRISKEHKIRYKDIFSVEYNSEYLITFERYMKSSNEK